MPEKATRKSTKRISDYEWRLIERSMLLDKAFSTGSPVEIDGVTIDLQCDLDFALWKPLAALGTYTERAALYGPRIIFPWTPSDWRKSMEANGAINATAGCRVSVGFTRSASVETGLGEFEVPEARERRLLHLRVSMPDGQVELAKPPLVLIAQTATAIQIDQDDDDAAYLGLVAKLERAVGLDDLETMLAKPIAEWIKPTRKAGPAYGRALFALARALDGEERAFVSFGYMMARAEAEQHMLPPAVREQRAARGRAKGAETRRAQSLADTEPLRVHAAKIIDVDREISLTKCSKLVSAIVASDENWKFSSDPKWIADRIRDQLFEERKINGRTEYRPKRVPK